VVGLGGKNNNNFYDAFYNFDGESWIRSTASTFGDYLDVWAPSGSVIYVVGTGTAVYRGTK
jgi:hypothetical protein